MSHTVPVPSRTPSQPHGLAARDCATLFGGTLATADGTAGGAASGLCALAGDVGVRAGGGREGSLQLPTRACLFACGIFKCTRVPVCHTHPAEPPVGVAALSGRRGRCCRVHPRLPNTLCAMPACMSFCRPRMLGGRPRGERAEQPAVHSHGDSSDSSKWRPAAAGPAALRNTQRVRVPVW